TPHPMDIESDSKPGHRSFRLTRTSHTAEIARQVRPAMVLPERDVRNVVAAAQREDITCGGRFSVGPAGVQVWNKTWDGPVGSHGDAEHVGSVDWSYNTPVLAYATIYRVLVTAKGVALGETTESIMAAVLALGGLTVAPEKQVAIVPPPRDPFRASRMRERS
ncbi:MAG: hypothetical protein JWL64_2307, partial [Frankiales bacterium]|nr:hypothetical protein [Frankiales bacterium]